MQVFAQDKGDLAFGPGLNQVAGGKADVAAVGDLHAFGEETEVRLVHVEHLLHGAAGNADLLADHALARGFAAGQKTQGNAISVVQGNRRITVGQWGQAVAFVQGTEELVAQRFNQVRIHREVAL
ncbi:hypothetical protein D9M73_252850 [compost metagenome]